MRAQRTAYIRTFALSALVLALVIGLTIGIQHVSAQTTTPTEPVRTTHTQETRSPMHPTFPLLDSAGNNVLESGNPMSTVKTCGRCHDVDFILKHSYHLDPAVQTQTSQNPPPNWDITDGILGTWDPLSYRYRQSGSYNLASNCFLCHTDKPNIHAWQEALRQGDTAWANSAILLGTGILRKTEQGWQWNPIAFQQNGDLEKELVRLRDPQSENCAACHGPVHENVNQPVIADTCNNPLEPTGQIIAGQHISRSGMNIENKEQNHRPWDIHAERGLSCVNCHYAPNNPAYAREKDNLRPPSLTFDPRRLTPGEYLKAPDHNFARGETAQHPIAPTTRGTMRECADCHNAQKAHEDWMPYMNTHLNALSCQSCHIPKIYAPAPETYDWTVIMPDGSPRKVCRGVDGSASLTNTQIPFTVANRISGYEPILLWKKGQNGEHLAPYNLVTVWFWVYDDENGHTRPVELDALKSAWMDGDHYAADVINVFDSNHDHHLSVDELRIDTDAKRAIIAKRLAAQGLHNPRIEGLILPYSIGHNVADGEWATRTCTACHGSTSRLTQEFPLSPYKPQGTDLRFVQGTNVITEGQITTLTDGSLTFRRKDTGQRRLYIIGHDRVLLVDWFGLLAFLGAVIGVTVHGALRYIAARRGSKHHVPLEEVYLYTAFERFWHWLQAVTIGLLLATGLIIHRPTAFGIQDFRILITIHNVSAILLIVDASLSLFYHLTTGAIREFIPRPRGFFDQAIVQAKYYISGIFKGEPHPFEKVPGRKLNPLQQATYFGLLNVLLPLQVITGALIWGKQYWPWLVNALGGLPVLAPIHTLGAWLFAAFVVGHVYLTTTGATPLESIRGMITGWERVEHIETEEVNKA